MATYPGRILLLAKTSIEWQASDPVLMLGEIGAQDVGSMLPLLKIGDGVRPYSQLPNLMAPVDAANDYVAGTTTTLPPGSAATVTIDNTVDPPTISFGIPRGNTGPPNSLAIGTVTTGTPGSAAGASITGTPPNQTLNLTIPTGAPGPKGDPGDPGPPGEIALADRTATVGLVVKNGVSAFAARSDSAPALDQAIAPTWTGRHTFSAVGSTAAPPVAITGAHPALAFYNPTAPAGRRGWDMVAGGDGRLYLRHVADDGSTAKAAMILASAPPDGILSFDFGNATDNPSFNFVGTGRTTFGGEVRFPINTWVTSSEGASRILFSADGSSSYNATSGAHHFTGAAAVLLRAYSTSGFPANLSVQQTGVVVWNMGVDASVTTLGWNAGGANLMTLTTGGTLTTAGTITAGSSLQALSGELYLRSRRAMNDANDGYLRINQDLAYASGVYTAGIFEASGAIRGGAASRFQNPMILRAPEGGANITSYLSFQNASNAECGWVGYGSGNSQLGLANNNAGGGIRISCSGGLDVVAGGALFQTAVTAASFNVSSSRTLKRETGEPYRTAEILRKLRPIFYKLLAEGDEARTQYGLIAEEVHAICPQLSDGRTVMYDRLAVLLLAEWQEARGISSINRG